MLRACIRCHRRVVSDWLILVVLDKDPKLMFHNFDAPRRQSSYAFRRQIWRHDWLPLTVHSSHWPHAPSEGRFTTLQWLLSLLAHECAIRMSINPSLTTCLNNYRHSRRLWPCLQILLGFVGVFCILAGASGGEARELLVVTCWPWGRRLVHEMMIASNKIQSCRKKSFLQVAR